MRASRWIPSFLTAGLLVTAALSTLSCGGDGTGPGGGGETIVVSPAADSLAVGSTVELRATVQGPDGSPVSGQQIFWNSEDATIATVSDQGVVTAVAPGTVRVAASASGKSGFSTITVMPKPVAGVSVNPSASALHVGQTVHLVATTVDADGNVLTGRAVAWTTSDAGIASVDSTGLVTAVANGAAQITATSEGKQGTAIINVSAAVPAKVVVNPTRDTITVGQTTQLNATVTDAGGATISGAAVAWSSGTPTAASVSTTGLVSGLAPGQTTITARSGNVSATSVVVVLPAPANAVVVSPESATLIAGETQQFTARVTDAFGNTLSGAPVTWSSNNAAAATIDGNGLVTSHAPGSATITASSQGKSGTATVTVKPVPVANVIIAPDAATLTVGQTLQLQVTLQDANGNTLPLTGRTISWATTQKSVATVSGTGLVTAVAAGGASITATVEGVKQVATITVNDVPVDRVVVTPSSATVQVGATTPLSVQVLDANGNSLTRPVTWKSTHPEFATVSGTGVVTGVAPGGATIIATSGGQSDGASITVIPVPVDKVTVSPSSVSLTPGGTQQLTATVTAANGDTLAGRTVTWSSSDENTAKVDATGKVTAVAVGGPVTITATSTDDNTKTGTASVTVTPVPVGSVEVAPNPASVVAGSTVQLTATVKDGSGNVLTGRTVTWMTSDANTATVDANGLVTGVAASATAVTITATSEGKSGASQVTVTAPAPAPVATVEVTPPSSTIDAGTTVQLTATLKDGNGNVLTGRTVTWASSDENTATVDGNGLVTGVAGSSTPVTITATSEGQNGTATVTVNTPSPSPPPPPPPGSEVSVVPPDTTLLVGQSAQFAAHTSANGSGDAPRVTWHSSDDRVATVSSTGVVTAVDKGKATITAVAAMDSGRAKVTVAGPPKGKS